MKSVIVFCAALAVAPAVASAEESASSTLEPIIVTATRTEQPASEALASVIVITREEIERSQAADIAELLRFHAGLDIGRNGGPGQVTSVFVRGGESNHTLVLIDGVRVNPATAGGAALQNIAPAMIERIEIVKGPRTTLYGADAIAGVINIITRTGTGAQAAARVRGGRYDTGDGSVYLAYGRNDSQAAVSAQRVQTDGFPTCAGATLDRGFRNTSVNFNGRTRVAGVGLSARVWDTHGNTQYLDFCDPQFGFNPLDQDFRNQALAFEATATPADGWDSALSMSLMQDKIEQNQSDDFVRTIRPSADWHNTLALGSDHRFSFGASAADERVDALSFGAPVKDDRDVFSGFVQDEFSHDRHHLLLAAAGTGHDAFGKRATWNTEYGYDVSDAVRLIGAAGTGFRAPDATDRFGFGGNPDLKPERALNYELGLNTRLEPAHVFDLRLFRNRVRDLIVVQFDPNNNPNVDFGFRAVNLDRTRNQGVELTYRFDQGPWSATVTGIAQDPKDLASGERLLRRARRSLTGQFTRRFGAHYVALDVLAQGRRPDIDASSGAPTFDGGYALLNLTGGVRFLGHWSLDARLENLLDKTYQTAAGFNQPGASFYLTAGYRY